MATLVSQMGGMVADQYQIDQLQYVSHPTGDEVPKNSLFPNESIPVNNHVPFHTSSHYGAVPCFDPHWGGGNGTPVVPIFDKSQGYPDATPVVTLLVKTHGYLDEDQMLKKKEIRHFSHRHPLRLSEFQEEDSIVCSVREIKHESHLKHPLALISSPLYQSSNFTCDACLRVGSSFAYQCKTCKFDLHVNCASLPKTVKRGDHEHKLVLLYSSPYKKPMKDEEAASLLCDVCDRIVDERCWVYNCKKCDFGSYLECVSITEDESPTTTEMEFLKSQMEMNTQNVEFMLSLWD
ncbi:hypothetical protein LguiB_011163 [Lonicera macranthoides]